MDNILKQTIKGIRHQPLLAGLTIFGTAVSICLIMVVVMGREAKLIDYANEPNRSRTLYASSVTLGRGNAVTSSFIGPLVMTDVFLRLKTPEKIAIFNKSAYEVSVGTPSGDSGRCYGRWVNAGYFDVFAFDFIDGGPFTKEECASNMQIAIISESLSLQLFGRNKGVTGQTLCIKERSYAVKGVVKDVSIFMESAFSDVWIPMDATTDKNATSERDLLFGYNNVAILARSEADFPAIEREFSKHLAALSERFAPDTLDIAGGLETQEAFVHHSFSNKGPDMEKINTTYIIIIVILLIVPAINIASMTQSRLRQRRMEIGVRRAFGATRRSILWQSFLESFVLTLIAGALGLVLSFVLCYFVGSDVMLNPASDSVSFDSYSGGVDPRLFFQFGIYCRAIFFCLLLNTLSAMIPAWNASRSDIVKALK